MSVVEGFFDLYRSNAVLTHYISTTYPLLILADISINSFDVELVLLAIEINHA